MLHLIISLLRNKVLSYEYARIIKAFSVERTKELNLCIAVHSFKKIWWPPSKVWVLFSHFSLLFWRQIIFSFWPIVLENAHEFSSNFFFLLTFLWLVFSIHTQFKIILLMSRNKCQKTVNYLILFYFYQWTSEEVPRAPILDICQKFHFIVVLFFHRHKHTLA